MTDFTGQTIGRYQIIEAIGEGGMATVYKAFDTHLERHVAIKAIRADQFTLVALRRMLQRFEREAKSLAKLSHPNIVGVIDYGEYKGAPLLVMEYLSGGTLRKQVGRPMPWAQAVRLLLPIARALEYAHQHGIIHRDVKPSNILITETGETMLSDFGVVKILEGVDGQTLTATGVGMGTPGYMAPEQWTGHVLPQSDVYSLGVVLYELVTGRKPYTADTPAAILIKQVNQPLPRPKQFVPDLPDAVEKVLFKALAREPGARYRTMDEMAKALEWLLSFNSQPLPVNQKMAEPARQALSAPLPAKRSEKSTATRPSRSQPILMISIIIIGILAVVLGIRSLGPLKIPLTHGPITFTPTHTFTPIPTNTPTSTSTPAYTPTSTHTHTPTYTPTETSTKTETSTNAPTMTLSPTALSDAPPVLEKISFQNISFQLFPSQLFPTSTQIKISCDETKYYGQVFFHDPNGDATTVYWNLISSVRNAKQDDVPVALREHLNDISAMDQQTGASFDFVWFWRIPGDGVRIQVTIKDSTNKYSNNYFLDFTCK